MRIPDSHFHVETEDQSTPEVMSYFAKTNPEYSKATSEEITSEAVIANLNTQAVDMDKAERARKIEELPFSANAFEALLWGHGSHLLGIDSNHDREKG
jgi:hypothetical protein